MSFEAASVQFYSQHMHPTKAFLILLQTATLKQPIGQDVEDGGEIPCQGPFASQKWSAIGIRL